MKSKFSAKVGHGCGEVCRLLKSPSVFGLHVGGKVIEHALNLLQEIRIVQPGGEFGVGNVMQHVNSAVVRSLPCQRRKLTKDLLSLWIPCPPQITRQYL